MLRRLIRKHWRALAILGLCAYAIGMWWWASLGFPAQEQICGDPHQAHDHNCAARQIIALGHWVHEFHDELLVVGTFLLAFVVVFQIRDTRKSSERQLRAYVTTLTGFSMRQAPRPVGTGGVRFEFRPGVLNTGQTPAYNVTSINAIRFLSYVEALEFTFVVPPLMASNVLTLGSRQDRFTQVIFDRKLTRTELKNFRRGTHAFFVYGTIHYTDAFDDQRYSNYAYVIGWWGKRGTPIWHSLNRHNDSD